MLIWLASYPKSGNTWMRAFLLSYMLDTDSSHLLSRLGEDTEIASSRRLIDNRILIDSSDLTFDEVGDYRRQLYLCLAREVSYNNVIMKVHDAYIYLKNNSPLFPVEALHKVVYIIRNPLDIAVSFAHHQNLPFDIIIQRMGTCNFYLTHRAGFTSAQVHQKLLTWSQHVLSWVDAPGLSIITVRYEDLLENPYHTFGIIIRFLFGVVDDIRLNRAILHTDFKALRNQEEFYGFRERLAFSSDFFFRRGRSGSWKAELTSEQVKRVVANHRDVMRRFDYLDDKFDVM